MSIDYKGSVTLISGLTQANNGSFPLVDGDAIQYKQEINEDGTFKSVSQKLSEFNRSYEYATSDDIDGIINGLFGQWKRLSLTEDTILENTFKDQLKILSVNGNSYQPTSNNIVPTPEKPIPIISKKTSIKRISQNVFDLAKESDVSKIPETGSYRSIGQHQLKPNTKYVFSWSGATVPAKATLSFQIQDDKGKVLVSPFTYFNLESVEKNEAGKQVEFTTTASGIVKFAYNCIVNTSSTTETYQQYWYTKILKDITLKESVPESEQIELRSLRETGNLLFDDRFGWSDGYVGDRTGSIETSNPIRHEKVSDYQLIKPNTSYSVFVKATIPDNESEQHQWVGIGIYDNDKNFIKREAVRAVSVPQATATFTTPANAKYFRFSYRKYNDGVAMLVEGTSAPSTYIPPAVRDYKIINHTTKTAKIVRNVQEINLNNLNFVYNDTKTDYSRFYTAINPQLKYGGEIYSNVFPSYYSYDYTKESIYGGNINGGKTISIIVKDSNVAEHTQEKLLEYINNPNAVAYYALETPIEEEIVYSETDSTEAGFSHQDNISPSISTPSKIESVDKVDIMVCGKNLLNADKYYGHLKVNNEFTGSIGAFYNIKISLPKMFIGKKLTFSALIKPLNQNINVRCSASIDGKMLNGNSAKTVNEWSLSKISFVMTNEDDTIFINYNNNGNICIKNIQLESDEYTQYEPYKPPQFLSYQLATPLKGINDTKDIIDVESNKRTNNITTFVLDDKYANTIELSAIKEKTCVFLLPSANIFNSDNILCNRLKNDRNKDEELFNQYQDGTIFIAINKDRLETQDVAGFRKWLKDNPLTFIGSATTPTQEALPEDLTTELNKLKTNDGSTVIYINSEVKPSLDIEYKGI